VNRASQLEVTRRALDRTIVIGPRATPNATVRLDSVETGVCVKCGRSHSATNRRRLIRPMRDQQAHEIAEAWPCFYAGWTPRNAVARMLHRDLAEVRR
jgi:hypothetical protein